MSDVDGSWICSSIEQMDIRRKDREEMETSLKRLTWDEDNRKTATENVIIASLVNVEEEADERDEEEEEEESSKEVSSSKKWLEWVLEVKEEPSSTGSSSKLLVSP